LLAHAALIRQWVFSEPASNEELAMGKYVVLNLEDKYLGTGKGAADSTVAALRLRYEQQQQPKGLKKMFLGTNALVEHRCVEVNKGAIDFTKDAVRLAQIRTDCSTAQKIYVVAHGDPRTTDICYTNSTTGVGVTRLATYGELGSFLGSVLPAGKDPVRMSLVMCYGARCKQYQRAVVDHTAMISAADLASSFAYQLYRELVKARKIKLTAVTGKIQHDSTTGRSMVEIEDLIDENMEIAEARKAQTDSKGPLIAQYKALLAGGNSDTKINAMLAQYRQNPAKSAANPLEQYAKDLVAWENSGGTAIKARLNTAVAARTEVLKRTGNKEELPKYGKFIYTYAGGVLTIASKYGKAGDPNMPPMTVLYQGALL
jgi:hypothetical protein